MLSIIVLEDDAVSAAIVCRVFNSNGHNARAAARIADAWKLLREGPADLLVLDTDLGGEWGWEMLERVRRSVVFRELPTIVYSSLWKRDIVRRYMLLGVQGLLVKPYTPARLIEEATRAAESGWREPFFEFPSLPEVGGPDGDRRTALETLLAQQKEGLELAIRLESNCTDIVLQTRMTALSGRARKAGFALLGEVAEKLAQAAIEAKADRLPLLREDMEHTYRILERLFGKELANSAPTPPAPTIPAIAADGPVADTSAVIEPGKG